MSDKEWACLEPFAVSRGAGSGRRPKNHRLVLDGIFWIARTGVAWRDLPEYFGKWSSVYRQFRRWTLSGLWELILDAFNDSGGGNPSLPMIDSTIIRAHHCSAGAKGGLRNRSWALKRWLYDKIHLRSMRWPAIAMLSQLARSPDYKGYMPVMDAEGPAPKVLLADKGYDANFIRDDMERRGGFAMIPTKKNRLVQISVDGAIYALRNIIERCFNKLKNARRLATRYDKTARSYSGFIHVISIRLWMKQFVNRS